jgi:hypothetical protein
VGLLNLTRLNLDVSYGTITFWRMLQVLGLPFIFIPISTLNYVGVPREQEQPDLQLLELCAQHRRLSGHGHADHVPHPRAAGAPIRDGSQHHFRQPATRATWRRLPRQ